MGRKGEADLYPFYPYQGCVINKSAPVDNGGLSVQIGGLSVQIGGLSVQIGGLSVQTNPVMY